MSDGTEPQKEFMQALADELISTYGYTDADIDDPMFGMFDHVTGRSYVRP